MISITKSQLPFILSGKYKAVIELVHHCSVCNDTKIIHDKGHFLDGEPCNVCKPKANGIQELIIWYKETRYNEFKKLGKVNIKESYQIEILKRKDSKQIDALGKFAIAFNKSNRTDGYDWDYISLSPKNEEIKELTKNLGFKDSEQMFKKLDEEFDLSKPKKFNIYEV